MTRQDYRRIYANLLDTPERQAEASYAYGVESSDERTVDAASFRNAVKATQERAAADLRPLTFDEATV